MEKRVCLFYLVICAILFSACENPSPQSSVNDANKAETNQNISAPTENKTINENLTFKEITPTNTNEKTQTNTSEKADFAGTVGITQKKYEMKSVAVLKAVRTSQHEGFDRAVFEFEMAEMPGYHIEYIDKPAHQCGSGDAVNLKGDGWLEIRFYPANAHTEEGKPTVENREFAPHHKIIKELKLTCDFEADVTWVLGVASPNEYRILELKNPTRLAVDIKH